MQGKRHKKNNTARSQFSFDFKKMSGKHKIIFCACFGLGFLFVAFLVWLFMSALSFKTELTLNKTYAIPGFNSLENIPSFDYGDSAVAIDGVVAKKSDDDRALPTASTAKMILGLAVMQEKPFNLGEKGETITIDEEMYNIYSDYVRNGGSNSRVEVGEEISEYDALMSVFLVSSNNMADSLAIWAFGSLDNYKDYANKMLEEWGIKYTKLGPDASGFNENTTSTASDLALIGQKVLENDVLKEIVGTKEYDVPVAGTLTNTNQTLGRNRIIGIKTGYIGEEVSGYCLISGYLEGDHIVTVALMGAPTRLASFNDSLDIVAEMQNTVQETKIISTGETVGYYDSWWTGRVKIKADEDLNVIGWEDAETQTDLEMSGDKGTLKIKIGGKDYTVPVTAEPYEESPSFGERLSHSFGWTKEGENNKEEINDAQESSNNDEENTEVVAEVVEEEPSDANNSITNIPSENCTIKFGYLMLINPNFTVTTDFIDARKSELISISSRYGIVEGNPNNGDNLLDAEAAEHLNDMVKAYGADYPGHTFETRSCYRARGTSCGRLCAATGASDHHTGLTCDLLDPVYGTTLDTDYYDQHIDWQWLYQNSYKYGFIDRFPEEWAGGSMSEPLNVDANGSTGLFETWHYRYVGVGPATEIATGKYNNGKYDSLEHYLKARGLVSNLKTGTCD